MLALSVYRELRRRMEADPQWGHQIHWAETVARPVSAEEMARELAWVIINAGFSNRIARPIFDRLMPIIEAGGDTSVAFRHRGKVAAMEKVWAERVELFRELAAVSDADLPEWCRKIPWIGSITMHHAAKNLGGNYAKDDRWLQRLAESLASTTPVLCQNLADRSGDRIGTVDLVLWWALANGHLLLGPEGPKLS